MHGHISASAGQPPSLLDDVPETPMPRRISKYHEHAPQPEQSCCSGLRIPRALNVCASSPDGMISTLVTTCMTINWVVGAGALGLPYVMQEAGVGVASVLLIATTTLLFVTATMLADAFARADAIERFEMLAAAANVPIARRRTALACCWDTAKPEPAAVPGPAPGPAESGEAQPLTESGRAAAGSRASSIGGLSLSPMGPASPEHYGSVAHSPPGLGAADETASEAGESTTSAALSADAIARHVEWLRRPEFLISHRKIELVELVQRTSGTTAARVYLFLVSAYLYGAMWSYAAVFGESFVNRFPFPLDDDPAEARRLSYFVYEGVFGLVAVSMSLLGIREQVSFQLVMTGVRVVVFGSMVITAIIALASADAPDPTGGFDLAGFSGFDPATATVEQVLFGAGRVITLASVGLVVPVVVYAQLFHTGTAVLVEPLRDKRAVGTVFGATYLVTTSVYLVIGATCAVLFGSSAAPSIQVNWVNYGDLWASPFAQVIGYIVVLFPGIDTLSVTPLNVVALASNIMGAVYGDRAPKAERNVWLVRGFRLLAALPPVIGACIVHDLSTILDVAGMVGLFIALVLPPTVWILTLKETNRFFHPTSDGPALSQVVADKLEHGESAAEGTAEAREPHSTSELLLDSDLVLPPNDVRVSPYTLRIFARQGCAWCLSMSGLAITLVVVLSLLGAFGAEGQGSGEAMD
ncbi:hypothetical protein FNF29_07796 [Cafeteria roenbergensis]|uniref:Amino acid transporter transmembrane domain-containing protein n=3 Tax=Cafeteria roenbergensis TaxID=33653 RepID=A0A5A8DG58_CAFRO|nr:hypothetical protein FNF29_07796 [Cafeteria roenbergensis]KAA0150127.1 hypothetical protein FNF31_07078 [Cafeteria roenbergensis]KAA0164345.1 hypothetical protein FNF28_03885 [Cafeteria roenbergensis]|eukprot:KAA0146820.1 hypothetical protein FNF29_07796 [Cafeteria roenbergensis]